jgi:hypothetical protein
MSDIVARSGVPFGSLYQYFPDKTAIIGTLAQRYNVIGRDCLPWTCLTGRVQASSRPLRFCGNSCYILGAW